MCSCILEPAESLGEENRMGNDEVLFVWYVMSTHLKTTFVDILMNLSKYAVLVFFSSLFSHKGQVTHVFIIASGLPCGRLFLNYGFLGFENVTTSVSF